MPGQPATPSLVRAINLRAAFDVLHARGPLGAPALVRETGLSRPTVAGCVGQLLELGLIRCAGRARGLPGPGAQLYEVNPRSGWALGLDVGRDWVRSALLDLGGSTVARGSSPTSAATTTGLISQLRAMAGGLAAAAGIALSEVDQVVVGAPGVMRAHEPRFSLAPNLPGWESPTVIEEIREALGAPVVFENDINLAAIGEQVEGVARGVSDFVVVSIGTGVGMGVVLDGQVRRGASGLAGEIAYLTLSLDAAPPERPPAWGEGAFEELVSAGAIVRLARSRGIPVDLAPQLFDLARFGDGAARAVVGVVAERLAHGIAAATAVLDPELVVLGGGVGAGAGDLLLPLVSDALDAISPFSPRLAVSRLGAEAVLVGASAVGLRRALDRVFERVATFPPPAETGPRRLAAGGAQA